MSTHVHLGIAACLLFVLAPKTTIGEGELHFSIRQRLNLHPLAAEDGITETVRCLTSGVLIRLPHGGTNPEPELATSWSSSGDYRTVTFQIRRGVRFSDGTSFSPSDVEYTLGQLRDPSLKSRFSEILRASAAGPHCNIHADRISITFPAPLPDYVTLFAELPILSAHSPAGTRAVLGPFMIKDYKPGTELVLSRNPNYWRYVTISSR